MSEDTVQKTAGAEPSIRDRLNDSFEASERVFYLLEMALESVNPRNTGFDKARAAIWAAKEALRTVDEIQTDIADRIYAVPDTTWQSPTEEEVSHG